MKKITFLVLMLAVPAFIGFSSTNVNAQINSVAAGTILIEGSTNATLFYKGKLENDNGTEDEYKSFGLGMGIGYFLIDGLAIGLDLMYSKETHEETDAAGTTTDDEEEKNTLWGPKVAYYIGGMGSVIPYVSFAYHMGSYEYTDNLNSANNRDADQSGWELGLGATFMLNDSVGLFLEFLYGKSTIEPDVGGDTDVTEMQLWLGIRGFIGTK